MFGRNGRATPKQTGRMIPRDELMSSVRESGAREVNTNIASFVTGECSPSVLHA